MNETEEFSRINKNDYFALIYNIPTNLKSKTFRRFFSEAIETNLIKMCHFRHRPGSSISSNNISLNKNTNVMFIKFDDSINFYKFTELFNKKLWIDVEEESINIRCLIERICPIFSFNSKLTWETIINIDNLSFKMIESLPEFKPPKLMPKGNIGTPTKHFLKLIQNCKLPSSIITKLGLEFLSLQSRRIYSCVPFLYDTRQLNRRFNKMNYKKNNNKIISDDIESKYINKEEISSEEEEWDRFENIHGDLFAKSREKERLYESEIELVWEKGGPGIVWHTDTSRWQQEKEEDEECEEMFVNYDFYSDNIDDFYNDIKDVFEMKNLKNNKKKLNIMKKSQNNISDNLEINSIENNHSYENNCLISRIDYINKNVLDIHKSNKNCEISNKIRNNLEEKPKYDSKKNLEISKKIKMFHPISKSTNDIGKFEKHTKGIGSKIMKNYGWNKGKGLGSTIKGISYALEGEGQLCNIKTGLGYYSEKKFEFSKSNKSTDQN